VQFSAAWQNRIQLRLDELSIDVIGLTDLIENKRATGRPKDLADLAALEPLK
jgi:hypothetical protein